MYILQDIKNSVENQIKKTLQSLDLPNMIHLETPSDVKFGDLAFPCFSFCKQVKKSPKDTAELILDKLELPSTIKKAEVHGGYINFWIKSEDLISKTIKSILESKKKYGILEEKNEKIIVEHTSANPNGPLHVGRARNPIIGDTIARLMKAAGYNVESQFYLDDLGKQVAILTWAVKNLKENELPKSSTDKPDHLAVRYYQKAFEIMNEDEQVLNQINTLVHNSELGDEEAIALGKSAYEPVLKGISESLSSINISIDSFIPESNFVKDKSVEKVINKLKNKPFCHDEDGALYLDLEPFGIKGRSTKFFITRSNGTSLYATRDIAYHLWKNNQADILINILGEDHKLESKQVDIALELLQADNKPIPIFYSFVSLPGGKMSTRRGRVVYLDDLIQESISRAYNEVKKRRENDLDEKTMRRIAYKVGVGAIRYNIIKVQPEKHIEFKWEEALSFEGNTSPFIQYAIARCASIIKKSTISKDTLLKKFDGALLIHESEIQLGKQLALLPTIIDDASKSYKPHLITQYLFDTASIFNQFYRDCPVLSAESNTLKQTRLTLVNSTKIVLENGLNILGIDSLKEM